MKNTRAGFTLIEMVLVLTLLTTILGGTIGLMTVVRSSDHRAAQNALNRQDLRRFADDIRRDVRAAEEITLENSQLILTHASSEETIVYHVDSNAVVSRSIKSPSDSSAPPGNASQDHYVIGREADIQIQVPGESDTVRWTITEADRPQQPVEILAQRRSTP